ncbi:MAG: OmpA family protein [Pseudomonadota bacterium]
MIRTIGSVFALALLPAFGIAEEMTDEELAALFESQRDALESVTSGLGQARGLPVGATRGLTLVKLETPAEETAATETEKRGFQVADDAQEDVPAPQPELTYAEFAPEYQINVRITFDYDSAALRADQKPQLQQLCRVMKATDIEKFRVVGHTDAQGSETYNERLSRLRAEEVERFFVSDCGIAGTRIEAIGVGERFPADSSNPDAGENRRVEFQALS